MTHAESVPQDFQALFVMYFGLIRAAQFIQDKGEFAKAYPIVGCKFPMDRRSNSRTCK